MIISTLNTIKIIFYLVLWFHLTATCNFKLRQVRIRMYIIFLPRMVQQSFMSLHKQYSEISWFKIGNTISSHLSSSSWKATIRHRSRIVTLNLMISIISHVFLFDRYFSTLYLAYKCVKETWNKINQYSTHLI